MSWNSPLRSSPRRRQRHPLSKIIPFFHTWAPRGHCPAGFLLGSLEVWRLEEPQRLRPGLSPPATVRPNAARLLPCRPKGPNLPRLRTRRSTKGHKGLPEWACRCEAPNLPRLPPMFRRFARKTLRYLADWSRLGAGYRRQDAPGKLGSLEAWTGLCPSPRRGALCSLFSVHCSPLSGAALPSQRG